MSFFFLFYFFCRQRKGGGGVQIQLMVLTFELLVGLFYFFNLRIEKGEKGIWGFCQCKLQLYKFILFFPFLSVDLLDYKKLRDLNLDMHASF